MIAAHNPAAIVRRFLVRGIAVVVAAVCTLTTLACDRPAQARAARGGETVKAAPGLVVDSILSAGEALRRFQSGLRRVGELSAGVRSRDELVARFWEAVASRDTAALKELVVSKAEYAFLYFPSSVYSSKPYELAPDVAWLLSEQNSLKGFRRLTRRLGGKQLEFSGYDCGKPITEGANRFWGSCQVSYMDPISHRPVTRRVFGAIIERDGHYKFMSYANDF